MRMEDGGIGPAAASIRNPSEGIDMKMDIDPGGSSPAISRLNAADELSNSIGPLDGAWEICIFHEVMGQFNCPSSFLHRAILFRSCSDPVPIPHGSCSDPARILKRATFKLNLGPGRRNGPKEKERNCADQYSSSSGVVRHQLLKQMKAE